jgi:predicted GNAT family acetyltransferase
MDIQIHHQPGKFSAVIEGQEAYLLYELHGKILDIRSTYTPPPLRGRNIAAKLTDAAFAHAKEHNLKIKPTCSYTRTYLLRHPSLKSMAVNP